MPRHVRRRGFLGASGAAMAGLAGCQADRADDDTTQSRTSSADDQTPVEQQSGPETRMLGPGAATVVIGHRDGKTLGMDGHTGAVLHAAPAGEDDAAVIQKSFEEIPSETGGSVFFERGRYEIGQFDAWEAGIAINANNLILRGDFAHLRFHEHSPETTIKRDLAIGRSENVHIEGLILDGNREDRSSPTRTLDICCSSNVTIDNCLIRGGRRVKREGGAGYGISPFETEHLTVSNCLIRDNDRHGIHPGGNEGLYRGYRIVNNTFINNASNPSGAAIDIRDRTQDVLIADNLLVENGNGIRIKGRRTDNILIQGNLLRDNDHPEATSSQIEFQAKTFGTHRVTDNRLVFTEKRSGPDSRQITLSPGGDGEELAITNNDVTGGDVFVARDDDGTIEYLEVDGNSVHGTRDGIVLGETGTAIVTDNVLRDIREAGIVSKGGVERGAVVDNLLVDARIDDGLDQGLTIGGNRRV